MGFVGKKPKGLPFSGRGRGGVEAEMTLPSGLTGEQEAWQGREEPHVVSQWLKRNSLVYPSIVYKVHAAWLWSFREIRDTRGENT